MKTVLTRTILSLACCVAPFAQAQNCGSGGGTTVCLSAAGTGSDVRLSWSVSGAVSSLQVYRDTDSDPNGRSRLATLGKNATGYTDSSATPGAVYWYWVKFSAGGGSFSSGAAHAVRVGVMRNMTSMQMSAQMAPGWNLGNSLEASGTNETYADGQFQKMKTGFIDKGVPVLMGEFAAIQRTEYDAAGTYRKLWDQYVTRAAFTRGVVPMYWDNSYTSNHQMGLFDRNTGAQAYPDVIGTIVNAAK